ncbi:hypothetical protein D3C86_1348720 [compost metagenome]
MGLEAHELKVRVRDHVPQRLVELVRQVEAELGVHVPRPDVLVGVGLHARRDAQEQLRGDAQFLSDGAELVQLVQVVDHEAADPLFEGQADLFGALVVALEVNALGRDPRLEGREELAARDHLRGEALVVQEAIDRHVAKGLAREEDLGRPGVVGLEGVEVGARRGPQRVLVHHVEGSPVGPRQLGEVAPPELPATVRVDVRGHGTDTLIAGLLG